MKTPSRDVRRAPQAAEALALHKDTWGRVFVARAALGLPSVLVVGDDPAAAVAVVAPAEASALLKQRGDARGAARVVGTATPGSVWTVSFAPEGAAVAAVALGPYLAG